jgi:hypothetical protein
MCGARTVLREVVVASGGRFTVKLAAENERLLSEREGQALPPGAVVTDRRLVYPRAEVLKEIAADEEELRERLRQELPQFRIVAIVTARAPATGILGIGRHVGEYEVRVMDTQLRSEVTYELKACVEVVALATATDCLEMLRQPTSPKLAAARYLAEHADSSQGEAILDALEEVARGASADRQGGRDIYLLLIRALERAATPRLIPRILASWAPALVEWQTWRQDDHLRAVVTIVSNLARSTPGFEALSECLRAPDVRVREAARNLIQRLDNVVVSASARQHMQKYEEQRTGEVRAWLQDNDPLIARDRFCLDLLGKLAERKMRITGDPDELSDWCRERGLVKADGETLANALVSVGLAVGPWQESIDRQTHAFYGITDNGRSMVGATLFAR